MKILIVISHTGLARFFHTLIDLLKARGYTITVVFCTEKRNMPATHLIREIEAYPQGKIGKGLKRRDKWAKWLKLSRRLLDYGLYSHDKHTSKHLSDRLITFGFPRKFKPFVDHSWVQKSLGQGLLKKLMRRIERWAPASPRLIKYLRKEKPDFVLTSPLIFSDSRDLEYLKAAKALGLKTASLIPSWDNLTTKGIFHLMPDQVFLWNEALKQEAIDIHEAPAEQLVVTGTSAFDYLFGYKSQQNRKTFEAHVGKQQAGPYVLYLCSSGTITGDETQFVRDFLSALQKHEATQEVTLLIRPHPLNYEAFDTFEHPQAVVWPKGGALPDNEKSQEDFSECLHFSSAVVGVNTSAFLEAAILDKPCVTILSEQYSKTQSNIGHFQHLLNGRFIAVAPSHDHAAETIADLLEGNDPLQSARQQFVKDFIRPCGLDRSAAEAVLENIAKQAPANHS